MMFTFTKRNMITKENDEQFVKTIFDVDGAAANVLGSMTGSQSPGFFLCLGSTRTSDIEGVSAAGASAESRRLTPRYDAEALLLGRTIDGTIPVSPIGVVSPVVLTRACLSMTRATCKIVDCGTFEPPRVDHLKAGTKPAECVSTGRAMPLELVQELFQKGIEVGIEAAMQHDLVVIAECVPGGTTTAMALLAALGYDTRDYLSSSIPQSNHKLRWSLP